SKVIKKAWANQKNLNEAVRIIESIQDGLIQRNDKINIPELKRWSKEISGKVFQNYPLTNFTSKDIESLQLFAIKTIGELGLTSKTRDLKAYLKETPTSNKTIGLKTSVFKALVTISDENATLAEGIL